MKHNRRLPRVHHLTYSRGLCLLAISTCAVPGIATTNSGVDSVISNQINQSLSYPRGQLGTFRTIPTRTPTGLLYAVPWQVDEAITNAWSSSVEFGARFNSGDDDAYPFVKYTDWDEGAVISNFSVLGDFGGTYVKFSGAALGNDDQFVKAEYGRYGSYWIRGFYNETPHIYATDATLLFNGIGSEVLTLPDPLVPGGNTLDELEAALADAPRRDVGIQREKWGGELRVFHLGKWTLDGKYTLEEREGTRPFGGSFYPASIGGAVETLEPIDDDTHTVNLGASYVADRTFVNMRAMASYFDNDNTSLTWDNPFDLVQAGGMVPPDVVRRGRMSLAPDNEFFQFEFDIARLLAGGAQLTASAAWSRMSQDEDLLPPTITSGDVAGVDTDNWNTTAALSQTSADAEIDSLSGSVEIRLNPWPKLSAGLSLDYYEEENDTRYTAYNPLTDQFGYIAEDSPRIKRIHKASTNPLDNDIHYRSIPFDKSRRAWTLDATYRLMRKTTLGLEWRDTTYKYDEREVEESDETRVKVYLSTRALDWATIRVSYLWEDRDVDKYNPNPYSEYYSRSLPDYILPARPFTLDEMRKFDIGDVERDRFEARMNILVRDDMDLMLSAQYDNKDYGTSYGLQERETKTINLEWNYQPSATFNTYLFFSKQWFDDDMTNIADSGALDDSQAGGTTYPLSGRWSESSEETSDQLGVGISYTGEKFGFEASYTGIDSDTSMDYRFASSDATASEPLESGNSGKFSDISYRNQVFESSATWQANERWQLRLYYRYERGKLSNWATDGLSALEGYNLFIQAIPDDRYSVSTVGVFASWQF